MIEPTIERYSLILNHFTDDRGGTTRDWMSSPFAANGKAIATDAMKLVCTPLIPGTYLDYTEKVRNVYPVTPNMDKLIPLAELREKLSAWPQVDCFDMVSEKCDACAGDGNVEYEFSYKGSSFEIESGCPICGGKGSFEKEVTTPNGKTEPDTGKLLRIGNCAFKYDLVNSLLFVAETLQSDIRVLNQMDTSRPTLFSIGEVEVLLMAMYSYDEKEIAQTIEL